jgi:hypothetical protein
MKTYEDSMPVPSLERRTQCISPTLLPPVAEVVMKCCSSLLKTRHSVWPYVCTRTDNCLTRAAFSMPISGQSNPKFGVYISECCGSEIVIAEGARFPPCPDHPDCRTKWMSIVDEPNRQVTDTTKKRDTAA